MKRAAGWVFTAFGRRRSAARFLLYKLPCSGTAFYETLHVLITDVGRPRGTLIRQNRRAIFPPSP